MNKFRSLMILASVALPIVATSTAYATGSACTGAAGNVVLNCGFETGTFSSWTVTDPSNYSGVDKSNPNSGTYAASLGAVGTAGVLKQTVTDVSGAYYALTFELENEIAVDGSGVAYPGGNSFSVSYTQAGGNTYTLSNATNLAESGSFSTYEYFFFGTGSDTINFTYLNTPSYFILDDITVIDPDAPGPDPLLAAGGSAPSATPEPSSLVLMGTGVMALAGMTRRKFLTTSNESAH